MRKQRIKFYVEPKGFLAQGSVILMALAMVFRVIGCWNLWADRFFAATQILLPLASGLLFILFVLLLGKRALWTTSLAVLLGVAFFMIKAFGFESRLHMVLCLLLYLVVAILYVITVFALIPTKWLLVPLFALPFLYHVFVEDLPALRDTVDPVSFAAGMQEMSVLSIMLALLFLSLAMKKKTPQLEDADLPRIKDPKVVAPETEESGAEEAEPQSEEEPEEAPQPESETETEPAEEDSTEETI